MSMELLVSPSSRTVSEYGVNEMYFLAQVRSQFDHGKVEQRNPSRRGPEDQLPISIYNNNLGLTDRGIQAADAVSVFVPQDIMGTLHRIEFNVVRFHAEGFLKPVVRPQNPVSVPPRK